MSVPQSKDFGSVIGQVGEDLRIQVGAKGRKNLLSIVTSYHRDGFLAPDAATFYGRLIVVEGNVPALPEVTPATNLQATGPRVLFDVTFHDLGPHTFFFPLAQLEGNVQTDFGGILTIILAAGQDTPNGLDYVGKLNAAGQTILSGEIYAGQRGVA